ncbi:predicted protein [Nematostella vectensis]|uniref:FAD-binding domain-containing protein n=1 Tax=Nematostella vectensis TaxID=45351 RepID=A7RTC7_NEMVE|nr:predicted protein [Nematostella vectensis]|eukprot:XP_001637249.1 predicted protein [Nematostella vectensis]
MANLSEDEKFRREVAIVGGGLVGALSAVFFAKRGYKVDLYESRQDPRKLQFVSLRSINLALSVRGISALAAVGCERPMVESGIPMHARMIHTLKGSKYAIPYGKKGQISAGEVVDVDADLLVGCDGAYSAVRKEIMRRPRFDYSQEYIPHGYKEICLPPDANGKHIMELNYLHIWPRNTFMMIALPNQDGTFTCTLFAPFDTFDEIKTNDDVLNFFNKEFPDFIPLIGEEKLLSDWFTNPVGAMVSVKCKPYHVADKVVILGDAAHAMVPFYGQGMNCGFEDCLVLNEILDKHNDNLGAALEEYSMVRNPDAEAMCDLAMYNYIEVSIMLMMIKQGPAL